MKIVLVLALLLWCLPAREKPKHSEHLKMYCGKQSIGMWLVGADGIIYECVSKKEARTWAKQHAKPQH